MNIRELLRALVGGDGNVFVALPCTVESVDGVYCDVQPIDDDIAPVKKVRLNANTEGLIVTPKVGSDVLVVMMSATDAFVAMFSEIESYKLRVTGYELQGDYIEFNGGENGGMTITPELKKQLDKMTKRIDGIIDAISNAVPVAQDGGVALQKTIVAKLKTLTDKESFSKIENEKIKH